MRLKYNRPIKLCAQDAPLERVRQAVQIIRLADQVNEVMPGDIARWIVPSTLSKHNTSKIYWEKNRTIEALAILSNLTDGQNKNAGQPENERHIEGQTTIGKPPHHLNKILSAAELKTCRYLPAQSQYWVRWIYHRPSTGPVLAHNGMFTGRDKTHINIAIFTIESMYIIHVWGTPNRGNKQ